MSDHRISRGHRGCRHGRAPTQTRNAPTGWFQVQSLSPRCPNWRLPSTTKQERSPGGFLWGLGQGSSHGRTTSSRECKASSTSFVRATERALREVAMTTRIAILGGKEKTTAADNYSRPALDTSRHVKIERVSAATSVCATAAGRIQMTQTNMVGTIPCLMTLRTDDESAIVGTA